MHKRGRDMHSQKNSEIRRDLTETRCTLATQRPIYNTRKASLDRTRGKIDASWPTRRRWASSPSASSSPDKINRGARPLSWCSEPWKKAVEIIDDNGGGVGVGLRGRRRGGRDP